MRKRETRRKRGNRTIKMKLAPFHGSGEGRKFAQQVTKNA
jgi:hypothetical protein